MNPINEIVVTYVTNALWMIFVIAAATSLLSRALRRCPSSYQDALWVAALLLAVSLPFASLRGFRNHDEPRPDPVAAAGAVRSAQTALSGTSSWALWRGMRHAGQPVIFGPLITGLVALLYFAFIVYRAVRLYCGWRSLRAILHRSSERPIPPAMRAVVERCHSRLGMKPVPILLSLEGRGPATLGIRNPVLVLPEWLLSQASEDEISSTLSHELAHIRRHDFLLNLVYELFLLSISFHPAAALIKARIDQTRELACDEIAAECLSTHTQYARSLLRIAQAMAAKQLPANVGYALGLFNTNTLEDRIMNVLERANRVRKTRAQALVCHVSFANRNVSRGVRRFYSSHSAHRRRGRSAAICWHLARTIQRQDLPDNPFGEATRQTDRNRESCRFPCGQRRGTYKCGGTRGQQPYRGSQAYERNPSHHDKGNLAGHCSM